MRTDEELIAERNIQIVASALLEVMNIFSKYRDVKNRYIRDLGDELIHKHGEQLQDIGDNGNCV